ncbi:unnamed protein product [Mesocestoides corti]|uniref:C2H2-type domain-containing protein n=1 Tax=Mesocestoides corti TaxID=53468 RepID=A0A3P6GW00_MESCO|nr:unnamed protein product [Mesocestoides corti]
MAIVHKSIYADFLYETLLGQIITTVVGKLHVFFILACPLVAFSLLRASLWIPVFNSVYWVGFIYLLWPFMAPLARKAFPPKPAQRQSSPRENVNSLEPSPQTASSAVGQRTCIRPRVFLASFLVFVTLQTSLPPFELVLSLTPSPPPPPPRVFASTSNFSQRKSFSKERPTVNSSKTIELPVKSMGRTGKVENAKSGAKRTRGRPRTKETKTNSATKRLRRRDSDSVNGRKSPQRENSLSPTHQDPPQLEPMPAVDEDEDLDIPMGFSALNSVDAYLCPGKCIVICPLASCRKKFSNPIDLVSHLRIYHESETFPSLKIYTCPTCLTTRFSSHTTSSDLTLLSEHAARYHGQNFKQTEFIYFCTIVLDILTGDKSTQQKEENNLLKKEVSCMASQPQPDTHYHPILPLVPNSASSELRSDVATSNAARVNADSLGLRISSAVLPQASSAGHYIQISPVPPKLPGGAAPAPQPPQPVLAALAAAAVSGQLQTSLPTGGQALLLPSHTPPSSSSSAAAVAAAPDPILINSASIYTPAHAKQLPAIGWLSALFCYWLSTTSSVEGQVCVFRQAAVSFTNQPDQVVRIRDAGSSADLGVYSLIAAFVVWKGFCLQKNSAWWLFNCPPHRDNSRLACVHEAVFISSSTASCTTPDVAQTIASVASKLSTHSASTEAAIETLKQLMQSAAVAKAQQTTPSGTPLQAPATVTLTQPTVATRNTVLQTSPSTLLSDGGQQRGVSVPKVVTKVDEPQSTQPLVYPFVQSVTVSSSSSSSGNAAVTTSSPVTVMTSNNELDSSSDLSPNASANADLLTLARLSVKQATAEASSQEAQQSTSTAPRNRRLLPRKSANTAATSTPILVRKRAALPPLAVKPPKESVAPLITPTKLAAPTPAHFSPLIPAPNNTEHVAMAPAVAPAASETIRQEEAPLMTAALISPPRPAPSTSTLIPSSLGSVLAKSRLLQASSYISVQPRLSSIQSSAVAHSNPHLANVVNVSKSTARALFIGCRGLTNRRREEQVFFKVVHVGALMRCFTRCQLKKGVTAPAPLQKILPRPNAGAVAATSAKDLRPLVYPVQSLPLQASTPAVAQVCPPVATTATKTQCLTVVHPSTSSSQINGNSAAATVTTKNTPSSPSELNTTCLEPSEVHTAYSPSPSHAPLLIVVACTGLGIRVYGLHSELAQFAADPASSRRRTRVPSLFLWVALFKCWPPLLLHPVSNPPFGAILIV